MYTAYADEHAVPPAEDVVAVRALATGDDAPVSDTRVPHVVILGGGFAGLYAAKGLGDAPVRVTVVDRRNHHLFQPMLYQVATAALDPSDIASPIRSVLRRQQNTEVLLGEATDVDVEKRLVRFSDGGSPRRTTTSIVATGARHSYFGHDEWEPLAPGLKSLEDALRDPPPGPARLRAGRAGAGSGRAACAT